MIYCYTTLKTCGKQTDIFTYSTSLYYGLIFRNQRFTKFILDTGHFLCYVTCNMSFIYIRLYLYVCIREFFNSIFSFLFNVTMSISFMSADLAKNKFVTRLSHRIGLNSNSNS